MKTKPTTITNKERSRMIVDLPIEVQMAIRLRAVKSNTTTGAIVAEAVQSTFSDELAEAKVILAQRDAKNKAK